MDPKNKLGAMPVRPLLYTMVVPLLLSLLIQSLYNIVDSIFVARLAEVRSTRGLRSGARRSLAASTACGRLGKN